MVKEIEQEVTIQLITYRLDNCNAMVTIQLGHEAFNGGPRILITYPRRDSEDADLDADSSIDYECFKQGKFYSIKIDKDELIVLKECIDRALAVWPIALPEES